MLSGQHHHGRQAITCSRLPLPSRDGWVVRDIEVGFVSFGKHGLREPGVTLTSTSYTQRPHAAVFRGSSGPTFRNPQDIDDARARKSPESLDLCTLSQTPYERR